MSQFFLLACLECGTYPNPPMSFESQAERGRWAARHTAATGHDTWWVRDLERTPGASRPTLIRSDESTPQNGDHPQ